MIWLLMADGQGVEPWPLAYADTEEEANRLFDEVCRQIVEAQHFVEAWGDKRMTEEFFEAQDKATTNLYLHPLGGGLEWSAMRFFGSYTRSFEL